MKGPAEPPRDGRPAWDVDLDAKGVLGLSPAHRRVRTLASFTRKVESVEEAARTVRPGDEPPDVPMDKDALRRLNDPARGMYRWKEATVDKEGGRYGDLVSRFHIAVHTILTRLRGGARAFQAELDLRDERVAALEAQVLALLDERRELREALARALHPDGGQGERPSA